MTKSTQGLPGRLLVVAGIAALTCATPVFSAEKTLSVSGDSRMSDCGAAKKADYALALTGSLTGCWSVFITHYNCQEKNGFSLYTEMGREEFDGKLETADTHFDTQYTFTGIFPQGSCPAPAAEKEIVGGCVHYITAEGLVGTIRFFDVMQGEGAPHYFYEGALSQY